MGLGPQKCSTCPYLVINGKAIQLAWGKNHIWSCTHTCPHPFTSSYIACDGCYMTSFNGPRWQPLSMAPGVRMTPAGSRDERHSAQSQEKNQRNMSLHGPRSYFLMEQFGVYLFCFKCDPRKGWVYCESGWLPLRNFLKFVSNQIWALLFLIPSACCVFWRHFSSQLYFCLTVLFILLNYEFFEGKTSPKFTKPQLCLELWFCSSKLLCTESQSDTMPNYCLVLLAQGTGTRQILNRQIVHIGSLKRGKWYRTFLFEKREGRLRRAGLG